MQNKNVITFLIVSFFISSLCLGKTQKIVVTGGPGVGKTSILTNLELLGECVVREVPADYLIYWNALGSTMLKPVDEYRILDLQKQREDRVPQDVKRVFLDRSCYDILAYLDSMPEVYPIVLEEAEKRDYDVVLFIEPLDSYQQIDVLRHEDQEEALNLGKKIEEEYRKAGLDLIYIKNGPLEQRVQQILDELEKLEKKESEKHLEQEA